MKRVLSHSNGLGFFAVLWFSTLLGCQPTGSSLANSSPSLVLGTSADYPPFEFRKDGAIVGFDVDVAQEIAQRLGYTLQIRDMDFSALVPALQSGQVDFAMSGMTATEERKKNLKFTGVYFRNSFALVTRKGTAISSEKDLSGRSVGVQLGTTMEKMGKQKAEAIPNLNLVSRGKNSILIEELKAGRLDAIILEAVQAQAFSKVHASLSFIELPHWNATVSEGYAIAFPKTSSHPRNQELKNSFDRILVELTQEGKLAQIKEKWLGAPRD